MTDSDALKAVEALAREVEELARICRTAVPNPFAIDALSLMSERLERLRKGCELLRDGQRGAPEAKEILGIVDEVKSG